MGLELIFKDRKFWPLFWTQFFGAFNDNFFKNALIVLITFKSVSLFGLDYKLLVPLAGGLFIFPFFLFSATAGQIADRYEKTQVIRLTKLSELVIMIFSSIGFLTDNFYILFFVLFLMGVQSAFFGPLKYGIIPKIVSSDNLVLGTAFVSSGTFVAILGGTIIGGGFTKFSSYGVIISLTAVLLALAGLICSRFLVPLKEKSEDIHVDYTFIRPTWRVLKLTMKDKDIFKSVLGISWFWFLGASILSLLPSLVKDVLNGDSGVATVFLAIFTIGMGLGSFLAEKISSNRIELGIIPISCLGMALFLFDLCFSVSSISLNYSEAGGLYSFSDFISKPYSLRVAFDLLAISSFGGSYVVPQMAYIQENSKSQEVARTIAGNNIWNALFMVSSALCMIALSPFGVSGSFFFIAIVNLIASFIFYALHSEPTLRFWGHIISFLFYDVSIKGSDKLPKEGAFIIATNHVSFIDWIFVMRAAPRPVRFVIDWSYYYLPTGPFWFRQAKLIPIATKKESTEILEKAYRSLDLNIKDGAIIGLFPEGRITRDGNMRKFQPGIQKITNKNPIPIILLSIDGLWGSLFSFKGGRVIFKRPSLKRRKVSLEFHGPIDPKDYQREEAERIIREDVSHYISEEKIK